MPVISVWRSTHLWTRAHYVVGAVKFSLIMMTMISRHKASTSTRWHFAFGSMLSHATIPNPPNRGHSCHFPNLHPGPCGSVGMRRGTDRHTNTQTHRRPWPIYISHRLRLTRNVIISVYAYNISWRVSLLTCREGNCFTCLLLIRQHRNVLQYKESK